MKQKKQHINNVEIIPYSEIEIYECPMEATIIEDPDLPIDLTFMMRYQARVLPRD